MAYYCLVDDERRLVFCVDPKCGCTTVKEWFGRIVGADPADYQREVAEFRRDPDVVRQADSYTRIWFVRDPLRRLASFYNQFVVQTPEQWCFADHEKHRRLDDSTFEAFLHLVGELDDEGIRLQHHLELQTRALLDVAFDRIVKIEQLADHSDDLMELLDIDVAPRHLNRRGNDAEDVESAWRLTPHELRQRPTPSHASFWNADLERIARRVYAEDLALYEGLGDRAEAPSLPSS